MLCITEQTRFVYERKLMRLLNSDGSMTQDHSDEYDDSEEEEEEIDEADWEGNE